MGASLGAIGIEAKAGTLTHPRKRKAARRRLSMIDGRKQIDD